MEPTDETAKKGSLEAPVVVEGKRERKAPEVFKLPVPTEKADFVIAKGKGKPIADLPDVCTMLEKKKGSDDVLQHLHSVAFGRKGPRAKVKANLREFSGFPFAADARAAELAKREAFLSKRTADELKDMLSVCCLERSGKKEELVARLIDFFDKPAASGIAPAAGGAKRKRAVTPAKKASAKKKQATAKASPAKKGKAAAAPAKKAAGKKAAAAAPEDAIAKPPSALELYLAERLPSLREKNAGVSDKELSKHLSDKWKTLAAEKKAKFEQEHKELQAKYKEVRALEPPRARERRPRRCTALARTERASRC